LQVFSQPEPEKEAPEPIDTPPELPGEDPPVPDPVDENLPEPLPEPPPQLEPEPSTEPASEPGPVPKPVPEREVVSEVEPEPDPVPRREPEQAFVPGREPEPEPAEKSEDVPPVDEPKEAQNTAAHDPLPEDAVKSTPKRKSNSGETKRPGFDPPPRENVESASDASVKKNRPVSEPSPIPGPPAPAIVEAKPKYLENDPPHYPRVARRRGYSGTVVVQVLVNRSGRAEEVQLASSSGHRILDKAALSAVSEWRFEPGTKNGIPVSMRVKVPVRFSLR
jgi:protein TonB